MACLWCCFLTAGLGSGSTFQMIAVVFRKITIDRMKAQGASDEAAQKEAVTESAAALGFISAIGAIGGFFIPKAFGTSLCDDGFTCWGNENLRSVLYRLRSDHLVGLWT